MKKGFICNMIIGIDIDDVLTNTSENMKKYLSKYETSGYGLKHFEEIMRGEINNECIINFYNQHGIELNKSVTVKENAQLVLGRLIGRGHKIIFITARDKKIVGVEESTLQFLKDNNIPYSDIVFSSFEKQIDCKKNNVDIMIDDSVKNCEIVRSSGIDTILFESEINKVIDTDIERAKDWLELEEKINLRSIL